MNNPVKRKARLLGALEESMGGESRKKNISENTPFFQRDKSHVRKKILDFPRFKKLVNKLLQSEEQIEARLLKIRDQNKICELFIEVAPKIDLLKLKKHFYGLSGTDKENEDLVIDDVWDNPWSKTAEVVFSIASAKVRVGDEVGETFTLNLEGSGKSLSVSDTSGPGGASVPITKFLG